MVKRDSRIRAVYKIQKAINPDWKVTWEMATLGTVITTIPTAMTSAFSFVHRVPAWACTWLSYQSRVTILPLHALLLISEELHFTEKARKFYFDLLLKAGGNPHEFRGSKNAACCVWPYFCQMLYNWFITTTLPDALTVIKTCFLRLVHNPQPLLSQKGLLEALREAMNQRFCSLSLGSCHLIATILLFPHTPRAELATQFFTPKQRKARKLFTPYSGCGPGGRRG